MSGWVLNEHHIDELNGAALMVREGAPLAQQTELLGRIKPALSGCFQCSPSMSDDDSPFTSDVEDDAAEAAAAAALAALAVLEPASSAMPGSTTCGGKWCQNVFWGWVRSTSSKRRTFLSLSGSGTWCQHQ